MALSVELMMSLDIITLVVVLVSGLCSSKWETVPEVRRSVIDPFFLSLSSSLGWLTYMCDSHSGMERA